MVDRKSWVKESEYIYIKVHDIIDYALDPYEAAGNNPGDVKGANKRGIKSRGPGSPHSRPELKGIFTIPVYYSLATNHHDIAHHSWRNILRPFGWKNSGLIYFGPVCGWNLEDAPVDPARKHGKPQIPKLSL